MKTIDLTKKLNIKGVADNKIIGLKKIIRTFITAHQKK